VRIEEFGGGGGVAAVSEHADLHPGDFAILGEHFELSAEVRARRVVDGFDTLGVLDRQRGDRGNSVAAVRGKSFQVRGRTRATRRIESRDG